LTDENRVTETSKVWQSQIDWSQEWHAHQTTRLPKTNDKIVRKESELALACSAAGVSPAKHYNQYTAYENLFMLQQDCRKLYLAKGRCVEYIKDSEGKIVDLEQKLRLMASS
jgi:hypothetical protein